MSVYPPGGQGNRPGPRDRSRPSASLGVFGGSFDPVHDGHLFVARAALEAFSLDLLALVPAARPPHKPGRRLASAQHRMAMLERAIRGHPRLVLSDIELTREGPSYTIDTVAELPQLLGADPRRVHLILGSDNLPDLPRWKDGLRLLEQVQPIVVLRAAEHIDLERLAREVPPAILAKIERGLLRLEPHPASSTALRAQLAAGREPQGLPEAVQAYIREHGLYSSAGR